MDELDLQKAIGNLVILQKEEFVKNLKAMAIASKAGFGSKEADREITKIARETEREKKDNERQEQIAGPVKVADTVGTKFDLKKLGEAKLSGGNNRTNNPRTSR